jgi:hypothetical protein
VPTCSNRRWKSKSSDVLTPIPHPGPAGKALV